MTPVGSISLTFVIMSIILTRQENAQHNTDKTRHNTTQDKTAQHKHKTKRQEKPKQDKRRQLNTPQQNTRRYDATQDTGAKQDNINTTKQEEEENTKQYIALAPQKNTKKKNILRPILYKKIEKNCFS